MFAESLDENYCDIEEEGETEFVLPDDLGSETVFLSGPVVYSFEKDSERLGCDFETAVVEYLLLERAQESLNRASDSLGVEQAECIKQAIKCVENIEYRDTTVVQGFIDSVRGR